MIFHLYSKFKILIKFKLTEGVGVGLLYPKTNATLLGKERYDDFHVSGYGTSLKAGLNLTFFKHFYIQGELKADISICKICTTKYRRQCFTRFLLFQRIIAFGVKFKI
jgi:hypothetical protein